jgi:DNA-binding CsgD family transcriptional regulator
MGTAIDPRTNLTEREREVVRLIADGLTDGEIGRYLNISVFTVQNHVKNILRKLQARNRTHASTIYHQQIADSSY